MTTTFGTTSTAASGSRLQWLARLGYSAKGIVYGSVGIITLAALYGWFGVSRVPGTRGALEALSGQPFGQTLLVLMTVGLAGYVLWRFTQGIRDTEGKGTDPGGWIQRVGFMISGLVYASLALYAANLAGWIDGISGGSGSGNRTELTARLMSSDAGVALVAATGIVLFGVGLYQMYRAYTAKFVDKWAIDRRAGGIASIAVPVSRLGIAARAITFLIIGGIVTEAALSADPEDAKGLGHALRALRDEPFGMTMLSIVGIGLAFYAVYCFFNARYRRIDM